MNNVIISTLEGIGCKIFNLKNNRYIVFHLFSNIDIRIYTNHNHLNKPSGIKIFKKDIL